MTEKELNQLYWLKKEIKQLDDKLQRLENMSLVGSPVITGMPFGSKTGDNVARHSCEVVDLERELTAKRQKYIRQANEIEKFINGIEDSEIRQIFRLRHAEGLRWEDIGGEMGMHRTTVSKKYYNFMKLSHKSHDTSVIIQA